MLLTCCNWDFQRSTMTSMAFIVVILLSILLSSSLILCTMTPTSPDKVTADVGSTATFSCITDTNASIRWLHRTSASDIPRTLAVGNRMSPNAASRHSVVVSGDSSQLKISEVTFEDIGSYQCQENTGKEAQSSFFDLTVRVVEGTVNVSDRSNTEVLEEWYKKWYIIVIECLTFLVLILLVGLCCRKSRRTKSGPHFAGGRMTSNGHRLDVVSSSASTPTAAGPSSSNGVCDNRTYSQVKKTAKTQKAATAVNADQKELYDYVSTRPVPCYVAQSK